MKKKSLKLWLYVIGLNLLVGGGLVSVTGLMLQHLTTLVIGFLLFIVGLFVAGGCSGE